MEWAKKIDNQHPIIQSYDKYLKKNDYLKQKEELRICINVIRQEISKLGFDKEAVENLTKEVLNNMGALLSYGKLDWGNLTLEEAAQKRLRSANANWKKAENTITAKKYWEHYFIQHPEEKPKHLVFYNGDPTSSVYQFQQKHGIGHTDNSDVKGKLLGFEDNHVLNMSEDSRVWTGYEELIKISNEIIERHYRKKE